MKLLLLSLALAGAPVIDHHTVATRPCPAEASIHRSTAHWFITNPAFAEVRNQVGLGGADASQLRLLTDGGDLPACQRLASLSAPGGLLGTTPTPWVYYRLGDRYVAVSAAEPLDPSLLSTRMRFLAVFDASFGFVDGFGF